MAEATINLRNNDPAYRTVLDDRVEHPDEAVYDGAGMQTVNFPDLRDWFDPYPNAQPLYARRLPPPRRQRRRQGRRPRRCRRPHRAAAARSARPRRNSWRLATTTTPTTTWPTTRRDMTADRRGDLRAFGCKSVEDAYMLAAALDIYNLCVMGYGLFASALTLQASVPGTGFDQDLFLAVKRDVKQLSGVVDVDDPDDPVPDYPDRLCYLPWSITLASSEGQSIDECFQILGRTFVDMRDDQLPDGWVVRMLGARQREKRRAQDAVRSRAPHAPRWSAPPTMLAAMRRLALLEQASACGRGARPDGARPRGLHARRAVSGGVAAGPRKPPARHPVGPAAQAHAAGGARRVARKALQVAASPADGALQAPRRRRARPVGRRGDGGDAVAGRRQPAAGQPALRVGDALAPLLRRSTSLERRCSAPTGRTTGRPITGSGWRTVRGSAESGPKKEGGGAEEEETACVRV